MRTVVVASGNAGKLTLVRERFGELGLAVRGVDPGDAEDRADPGYRTAVLAKLRAARDLAPGEPALAMDSGFEFEALGWQPGPLTRRWLAAGGWERAELPPGSAVRVVQWVAAATADGEELVTSATDLRTVRAESAGPLVGDLPLTARFDGPVHALPAVLDRAGRWLVESAELRS